MLNQSMLARPLALVVAAALTLAASGGRAVAASTCDLTGADAAAVANARAAVKSACDCAGASSRSAWRHCVRDTLTPLVASALSAACERRVLRIETRSTCGRPQRVVCCRTSRAGRTIATLRRQGFCPAPGGGSSCESESSYLEDGCTTGGCAIPPSCGDGVVDPGESCDPPDGTSCSSTCTLCLPDGCTVPSPCGNGSIDAGESCDPPNGTTCSSACTSCAPALSGEILLGCTSGPTGVDASALPSTLLVAYSDTTPGGLNHAVAKRLANDGSVVDAAPLGVSGLLPNTPAVGGFAQAATADGLDFYVGWATFTDFVSFFGGRRIPASGPITSNPDLLAQNFAFGFCRTSIAGPLNLAPQLAAGSFRSTWREIYSCGADILLEALAGVGDFFVVPPPGNVSSGPAPIVRGANDVAAVWWNETVISISPLSVVQFLAASWIEPGPPAMILLSHGFSPVAPALAAVGDTFIAVWASGSEVRALRFSRAAGPLDPDGGVLVATGGGAIDDIAAASDGSTVLAAWRESSGPGQSAIRAIRIAPDGTIPDPTPIEVAAATASGAVSVAANPSAALVAFTRAEAVGNSVRAVLLGH